MGVWPRRKVSTMTIAPRDKAKHWIIQGFHRMRLVALVKRCVIFGEPLVRAVFAFEHPVAGYNHIHLFGGVVMPRIIEVRRHIDHE